MLRQFSKCEANAADLIFRSDVTWQSENEAFSLIKGASVGSN